MPDKISLPTELDRLIAIEKKTGYASPETVKASKKAKMIVKRMIKNGQRDQIATVLEHSLKSQWSCRIANAVLETAHEHVRSVGDMKIKKAVPEFWRGVANPLARKQRSDSKKSELVKI